MENWQWVKDAEMDMLEYMSGTLAHNWAGLGNQVPFKKADEWNGHVTMLIQQTGAQSTDCATGMKTCPYFQGANWATKTFSDDSTAAIKSGALKHHLDIDMWITNQAMSLKIKNLKLKGGNAFTEHCAVANVTPF